MLKRSVRRSGGRRAEDGENGYEDAQSGSKPEGGDQTPLLLAEMARGMIDTQSKVNQLSGTLNNEEITTLLRQISSQLQSMQNRTDNGSGDNNQPVSQGSDQTRKQGQNQSPGQGASAGNSQTDLAALFSQLLNQGSSKQQSTRQAENSAASEAQPGNAASASRSQMQGGSENSQSNNGQGNKDVTQAAAQLLAQAQYELSNELEASLKKLKQVISESEKIAARIGNLLGEENNTNKS